MEEAPKLRHRILIAEDDAVSSAMLQALLTKWGYEITVATDGIEALRILQQEDTPPLVLLDWMMPGLDGPHICARVREQSDRPYVYVLLLTARAQKSDVFRGLEAGADDYLTKPFDSQELRARLHVGQRILDLQNNLIAAREELRSIATFDDLTAVANRAVVLAAVNREHSRQMREGGSFGVILIDLDNFKKVNDTHGHLSGDAVLKEAALRMARSIRPYDTVGRYGGEEFLVVVPSCDAVAALGLAERIRKKIQSASFSTDAGPVRLTASCGVAMCKGAKQLDVRELLTMADKALYRAKNEGRNCSKIAPQEDPLAGSLAQLPSHKLAL